MLKLIRTYQKLKIIPALITQPKIVEKPDYNYPYKPKRKNTNEEFPNTQQRIKQNPVKMRKREFKTKKTINP